MRKKLLFTLALLLTAATGAWADGSCGSGLTWTLSSGTLTISKTSDGTGAMTEYDWEARPWYSQKDEITSVVICDGVTDIGQYTFHAHSNLASLTIGNSLETIGVWAFKSCSMTSVTFPASVKSIGNSAFSDCNNLTSVTLNSNPQIQPNAFPVKTTVTMNLPANSADGAYWTTFYNDQYNFKANENTTVYKGKLSGSNLVLVEVSDKIVTAGKAVILKSTDKPVMTRNSTASSDGYDPSTNDLQGVMVETDTYENCYTLSRGASGTGPLGFYRYTGAKLGIGKAFLIYTGEARSFIGFDEDGTTAIEGLTPTLSKDEGYFYDLQGRPISGKPTKKGIYVKNGQKITIK